MKHALSATYLLLLVISLLAGLFGASALEAFPIWSGSTGGGGGGSGTVTSTSVVSANGLAGTVANPTTTPAITLSTSITGLLKGNGTAISGASSSDIISLFSTCSGTQYLGADGICHTVSGGTPGGSNGQLQYNNSGAFGGVTLTTTGTSGAATLTTGTLNIPQYSNSTFQQAMAAETQLLIGGL